MRNKRKKHAGKDTAMQYEWPIEPPEPWVDHSEEHQRHIEKFTDMTYGAYRACCIYAMGREFNERLRLHREPLKTQGTNPESPLPPQSKEPPTIPGS
jgi:hypothetical protein